MRKRGITYTTLAELFIGIVAFLVIFLVVDVIKIEGEGRTAEELCRMSIVAREKTGVKVDIKVAKPEVEVAPLLCSTAKSEDVKDMTKEEVKKYIAEKIARCWYRYQEGNVLDVFEGYGFKNECRVCQPFNVKKWKGYIEGDKITNEELVVFMYSNIYKVKEEGNNCKNFGGTCMSDEGCNKKIEGKRYFKKDEDTKCKKEAEKKICCYSPYDCLNKGGICEVEKPGEKYLEYKNWDCPYGQCWIKDENYYSYLDYIQKYGGLGRLLILTDDIHPGESYAVSFGSPTDGKGVVFSWATSGAVAGGAAAITAVVLGATPVGWVAIGVYSVGYIAAGTALGAVAGEAHVEIHNAIQNLFSERDINTIYFSTYNYATQYCEVVE